MKRKSLYVIIIALFFVGCSKQNLKTVNLSNDCKLNYTIDGNRVVNIEIIQSGEKIILDLPKQNEMLFSLSDSDKKCNVILSDDFYTVEISNGPNNICRLNKNCNNSSFDFIVNDDYRTVVQYDINNKISEHYEYWRIKNISTESEKKDFYKNDLFVI